MSQDIIDIKLSKRALAGLLCVAFGALGYSIDRALADDDPSTQTITTGNMILPYDGYLMADSTALQGATKLRFELFEDASTGTPEWTEEQVINASNGHFSAGLGAVEPLRATLLDAEKLWLAITVLEDDGMGNTTEIPLSGRQLIEPAPFAAWAAHSADFDVAGDLDVEGSVTSGGDLDVGGVATVDGARASLFSSKSLEVVGDTLQVNSSSSTPSGDIIIEGPGVRASGELTDNGSGTSLGDDASDRTSAARLLAGPFDEIDVPEVALQGVAKLEGAAAVRGRSALGSPDLFLAGRASGLGLHIGGGSPRIDKDLHVLGLIRSLSLSSSVSLFATGLTSLGVDEDEGFCFLTRVDLNYTIAQAPGEVECAVELVSGTWHLRNKEISATQGNIDCTARCVTF